MAFIHDEDGKIAVRAALDGRAAIGVVNWAEVLSKTAERGGDPTALEDAYREQGFIGGVLAIESLTEGDCVTVANMRVATRPQVALARRPRVPHPRVTRHDVRGVDHS